MLLNFGSPAGPPPAPASKKADLARNVWAEKPSNQHAAFSWCDCIASRRRLPPAVRLLLRIQFDDQLLVDGQVDVFPLRQVDHPALEGLAIYLQPARSGLMRRVLHGLLDNGQRAALLAYRDFVPRLHFIGRNVDLAAINLNVSVANKLARLAPRYRESHAVNDVVQAALQLLQQQLARDAGFARRELEIIAELFF